MSRQTVSNVINSPHLVRDDTLARVRAAIDDLGYRPSHAARQMRTRRSHVLGVRIEPMRDGVNGVVLDRFLHALTEGAQDLGYRLMLFTARDDEGEIRAYEELTASLDIDGFVLTSTHHGDARTAWLAEHGVPLVTFGRPWGAEHRHAWVDVDGATGPPRPSTTSRRTATGPSPSSAGPPARGPATTVGPVGGGACARTDSPWTAWRCGSRTAS